METTLKLKYQKFNMNYLFFTLYSQLFASWFLSLVSCFCRDNLLFLIDKTLND